MHASHLNEPFVPYKRVPGKHTDTLVYSSVRFSSVAGIGDFEDTDHQHLLQCVL